MNEPTTPMGPCESTLNTASDLGPAGVSCHPDQPVPKGRTTQVHGAHKALGLGDVRNTLLELLCRLRCRDEEDVVAPEDQRQQGGDYDKHAADSQAVQCHSHRGADFAHLVNSDLLIETRKISQH
eukprot:CAMPEP_0183574292 /NCGR_PEP_ID=MMETSP0371-20130417/133050_1 /TAXON_ID=268820 /ORGANISM="Peridinium aciculiferum, Strain PAER-2" /LENGTH=124 /DNA_ID=CAMNT_0025784347 /DNA_START=23 /DNA_END=398 /DNA_ORIENTATION=+